MDIENICIIGGSGFVGEAIADEASARGYQVRVVTRSGPRARKLLVLPTAEVMVADPNDEKSLARCVENMDAVVNLVGILHEGGRATFQSAHVELPRKIVRACHHAGVRQLLHMSALGASASGPSKYLRSKAEGEAAVREEAGDLPATVFRPSVIFGERDHFLNLFAKLLKLFPVIPLGGALARFQPVWVEDVARAFVGALGDSRTFGKTYELCGPRAYTLEELVRFVGETTGHRRTILRLPHALAQMQAFAFEHLPGKLMTRDNLRSMSVDNVCGAGFPAVFGFTPSSLEAIVPQYLAASSSRARYVQYRHNAGR
jgi:NADH dehydrogenase